MYKLQLNHKFCAAHKLTHAYSKECNDNIHGHNWRVRVEIIVHELINGMVIDFKKLKEIINFLDHKNLNDILDIEPTAENLASLLYHRILDEVKQEHKIINITIWEADNASISYGK